MMDKQMQKILRTELTGIYLLWHGCGLRKAERGLKKGTPCDECKAVVEEHIRNIGSALNAR